MMILPQNAPDFNRCDWCGKSLGDQRTDGDELLCWNCRLDDIVTQRRLGLMLHQLGYRYPVDEPEHVRAGWVNARREVA